MQDLPVSPVSLKAGKKARRKARHSPYARPPLPTPSSSFDVEFDFGTHHHVPYSSPKFQSPNGANAKDLECHSTSEYVMRIIRESPLEESQYAGTKDEHDECFPSSIFSMSPEPLDAPVTPRPSETMTSSKRDANLENVEVQMSEHVKEHVVPSETMTLSEQDANLDNGEVQMSLHVEEDVIPEDPMEEIHSSQGNEISKEPESPGDTRTEISGKDADEETTPPKVLAYGDLVVVDYAEKKKSYKWPAIVTKVGGVIPDISLFLQAI